MFAFNSRMDRCIQIPRRFTMLNAVAVVLLLITGIYACGGSSSTSTTPPSTDSNFKEVFTDSIQTLTPNVATSAVTDWDGWSACYPDGIHQYSVLNKLFNADSGVESIFGPVTSVENVLDILETQAEELAVNGTHEISAGSGTYTAEVSDYSGDFTVPFFNTTQTGLTKQVIITSADESFSTMVAYDMDGDDKAMVAHTKHVTTEGDDAGTSYELFHAVFNETSRILQVWVAYADDNTDAFRIQFIWKGNVEEGTFALTQSTDAAGLWQVLGGGDVDDQMSFRAVTGDSPSDDYFVMVTMDDITSATAPAGYPADSGTGGANIDSTTYAVQSYIDTDHDNCLGWLTSYPETTDLAWNY